jgi:hypothetical protein
MDREHHAIDYIELAATDLASSVAFYSQAFGWAFNDYGGEYAGTGRLERRLRSNRAPSSSPA